MSAGAMPAASSASGEIVHHTAVVRSCRGRQVERAGVDHLAGRDAAPLVADDLVGHIDRAEEEADRARVDDVRDRLHRQRGDIAGVGRPVRLLGVHERDPVLEIEVVDDVRDALVQVHRAVVHLAVRGARVDGAEQPAGRRLDDRDRRAAGAAQIDVGSAVARPVPAGRPPSQRADRGQTIDRRRRSSGRRGRGRPSVRGNSAAAQQRCGASTYGFAGSSTVASTGRPNSASGWCTR